MAEDSQCLAVTQKLSELQKLLSPCTVNQQHPTTIDKKNSSALVKYLHANALFYLHGSLCIKSEVLTKSSSSFIFKTCDMSKSIQIKAAQPGRKLHLQLPWEYTLTRVLNTIVTKQNIQEMLLQSDYQHGEPGGQAQRRQRCVDTIFNVCILSISVKNYPYPIHIHGTSYDSIRPRRASQKNWLHIMSVTVFDSQCMTTCIILSTP